MRKNITIFKGFFTFFLFVALTFLSIHYFSHSRFVAYANRVNTTCANSTSDAATINAAITSSSPGDEIVIQGTCLINSTITLVGNRTYRGENRSGTILKQANNANLFALFASDSFINNSLTTGDPVTIKSFTIDGNSSNNTATTDGIVLRSWFSTIEDVHIENMKGNGVRVTNLSANGTALTNTQVNGRIANNFIENSGNHGIYVQDTGNAVTDWILENNWIANSGVDGIYSDNVAGWMIERNHIYGVQQNAIEANRGFGTTISDNYIEDFGDTGKSNTWYGITVTVQGGAAVVLSNNRIFNFHGENNSGSIYRYLSITNVNYGTGNVSVTGNAIRGAGTNRGTGLYYSKGNGSALTVTSTGNIVTFVNTSKSVGNGVAVTSGQ